jgi:hypothetical protein
MKGRDMRIIALCFRLLPLFLLLPGCKNDPNGTYYVGNITGTVKNSTGQPVPYAYINMFYSSVLHPFPKSAKTLPTTSIEFDVPHAGFLHVDVQNYMHQFIRTLIADSVAEGRVEVIWDGHDAQGRDLYSDCFWVIASFDGAPLETKKMLMVVYQYDAANPAPFAMTDVQGRFSIPYSRLPLSETFRQTDFSDMSVREITIGPTDEIYSFTSTSYGFASVTYSNPRELTIILAQKK